MEDQDRLRGLQMARRYRPPQAAERKSEILHRWSRRLLYTREFFRAKGVIHGRKTPGGYFFVRMVDAGKVKFAVSPSRTLAEITDAGSFVLSLADFCELIEQEID